MEFTVRTTADLSPGWCSYCGILVDVAFRFLLSSGFFFFNYKGTKSKEGAFISHHTDLFITEAMSRKINLLQMIPTGLQLLGN